jgi:hypothetical protein
MIISITHPRRVRFQRDTPVTELQQKQTPLGWSYKCRHQCTVPSPFFPLYFAAVYFHSKRNDLNNAENILTEGNKLVTRPATNEDELLREALQLYQRFPPDKLENKQHHEVILLGVVAVILGVISGTYAN